jgi:hypothetical protein
LSGNFRERTEKRKFVGGALLVMVQHPFDLVDGTGVGTGLELKQQGHPFDALPVHGIRVTPLIDQAETQTFKDEPQVAWGVGFEKTAICVPLTASRIRALTGNGNQQAAINLEASLDRQRGIEQFRGVDVHQHGAAQDPIELTAERHREIRQQSLNDSPLEFRVELLGQLDKLWSPIQPKRLKALTAQLSQVATRATTYVQNAAARRKSRGKSSPQ